MRISLLVAGFGILMLLTASAMAALGALDTMVMPGEVIKGHADIEKNCKNCHQSFKKAAQRDLCLTCHQHEDIAKDIRMHQGFHGRMKQQECSVCHTDHKGRNVNISPIDEKTFNHEQTDFALEGGHAGPKVKCESCHKPHIKYRDTPTTCVGCHKKDDPHKGRLGEKCANCHAVQKWKDIHFDHSKTDYPLEGRHLFVKCSACHAKQVYKNTPKTCYACHRVDDKHKGKFGEKCATCHTPDKWKKLIFDHDRDTKYKLLGKHSDVACVACHKGNLYKDKLATNCYSCHKVDDTKKGHKGMFGEKCETCHIPREWKALIFDHDRDTKYPLVGKHKAQKCEACHTGHLYVDHLKTTCVSCHRKDDTHKGQEGPLCEQCHDEQTWKKALFDHGLTQFPLLGKHKDVACKKCHTSATFKDAQIACVSCHKKDDKHKQRLGPRCEDCHNANSWKYWDFNHDTRTKFPLDGAHKDLECLACHTTPVGKKFDLSSSCASCHDKDDIHNGSFGRFCEQCHVTSSFKKIRGVFQGAR